MKMFGFFLSMFRKFKIKSNQNEKTDIIRCNTYLSPMKFNIEDEYIEIDEQEFVKFGFIKEAVNKEIFNLIYLVNLKGK